MRNNEEFDRLARQKMNERAHAFDESQWLKAQQMIAGNRRNRGYLHFLWLLIPITATFIWLMTGRESVQPLSQLSTSAAINNVTDNKTPTDEYHINLNTSSNDIKKSNEDALDKQDENVISASASEKIDVIAPSSNLNLNSNKTTDKKSIDQKKTTQLAKTKSIDNKISTSKSNTRNKQDRNQPSTSLDNSNPFSEASIHVASEKLNSKQNDIDPSLTSSVTPLATFNKEPEIKADINILADKNETVVSTPMPVTNISSIDGKFSLQEEQLMHATVISRNVTRLWKVSVLTGLWNNETRTSGFVNESWMDNVPSNTSTGFGAEIIRSYHHFGWGTGVHYSAYSENLGISAAYNNLNETYRYWVLTPVDTSIWIVTDSIANGSGYTYVGYSEDHTINVIESATGTRNTNTLVRDARQIQNTVSYLEIPLIGDIHIGRGNWLFGLRGGPSIGKLIERRGTLPNPEGSGYLDLSGVAFQHWVPGYNFRGYVDYKIGMRWSIGLQAGRRGIIGNTLKSDLYSRKTNAWGGLMSLSYVLRGNH